MSRRRFISSDISVDKLINQVSEFAALLYSWMILHAREDCRLPTKEPEEIRLLVIPGRKDRTSADVSLALEELLAAPLIGQDDAGCYFFPADVFYHYQSYIAFKNRVVTPPLPCRKTPENSGNQRISAENAGEQRQSAENSSSLTLPLTLKDTESYPQPAVDNFSQKPIIPPAAASSKGKESGKGNEPWRPWADKIFASDKDRFKRIASFIGWAESKEYSARVIATGLERFSNALNKGLVDGDWWPYAKTVLEKAYAETCQAESERHKQEESRFLQGLISSTSRRVSV